MRLDEQDRKEGRNEYYCTNCGAQTGMGPIKTEVDEDGNPLRFCCHFCAKEWKENH